MRVTAVLVAYNRRELLQESLAALAQQTRPVDRLVIVDNASTDGAGEAAGSGEARERESASGASFCAAWRLRVVKKGRRHRWQRPFLSRS